MCYFSAAVPALADGGITLEAVLVPSWGVNGSMLLRCVIPGANADQQSMTRATQS